MHEVLDTQAGRHLIESAEERGYVEPADQRTLPARTADVPAGHEPDPKSVQRYQKATRYTQAGWVVIHIEGEPYARGYVVHPSDPSYGYVRPSDQQTYKLVVTAGSDREEYEGLTLKKGRGNIATKVNVLQRLSRVPLVFSAASLSRNGFNGSGELPSGPSISVVTPCRT